MLSLIQDIVDYEAPSLSVVEGGPGTGKTHLIAALAQELVERKHKLQRDCYVVIAAKSNSQLGTIIEKLHARNGMLSTDPQNRDPDAFRAVWLGNDQSQLNRVAEGLKKSSLRKLGEKHVLKQNTEHLEKDRKQLLHEIKKNDLKLSKLSKKNFNFPELSSNTAKMKLKLTLLTEKIESNRNKVSFRKVSLSISLICLYSCCLFIHLLAVKRPWFGDGQSFREV